MLTSPAITATRSAVIASNPSLPRLATQPVERVVLEDLPPDALVDGRALARPDEQYEAALGHTAQQAFDQRRADETRAPGDGDALARQLLGDHR
ncbi:MAG: hypothetical protein QM733_22230 [Ilumatobacteraceae bacterium]